MSEAQERPSRGYGNIYTPHAGSMIIQVQRESGLANRTIILSERQVQLLRLIASRRGMFLMGLVAVSWLYFAVQSARVPMLTERLTTMEHESQKIDTLQVALSQLQQRYEQVSLMLGVAPAVAVPARTSSSTLLTVPDAELPVKPPVSPATGKPSPAAPAATAPARDSSPAPAAAAAGARPPIALQWPLEDRRFITRGLTRPSAYNDAHPGVDIAVPVGTPIRAAGPGSVVEVGENAEYGRFIRLSHADGYETLYAHNSSVTVAANARVSAGEQIALSGNTGRSTAPHLHFEVRHRGTAVDPMQIINR